jgi:hypothetical protein
MAAPGWSGCRCRELGHVLRPADTRVRGRRADLATAVGRSLRGAGSAACGRADRAIGAGGGCCSARGRLAAKALIRGRDTVLGTHTPTARRCRRSNTVPDHHRPAGGTAGRGAIPARFRHYIEMSCGIPRAVTNPPARLPFPAPRSPARSGPARPAPCCSTRRSRADRNRPAPMSTGAQESARSSPGRGG